MGSNGPVRNESMMKWYMIPSVLKSALSSDGHKISGKPRNTGLPPMWPGFHSRLQHHLWLSLLFRYSATRHFSPGTLVYPSNQNPTLDSFCFNFIAIWILFVSTSLLFDLIYSLHK